MAVAPVLQALALTERTKEGPDWAPESHNGAVDDSQDINRRRERPGGEDLGLAKKIRLESLGQGGPSDGVISAPKREP